MNACPSAQHNTVPGREYVLIKGQSMMKMMVMMMMVMIFL